MLLALLLLAHAQADWVEITQHKAIPTTSTKTTTEPNELKRRGFQSTQPVRTDLRYNNHSLEHWGKGDAIRTHFTKFNTEPNEPPNRRVFPSTEPARTNNRVYINHSLEKHWSKGVVHRVANVDIKRLQLTTEEPARSKYEEMDLSDVSIEYTMRNPFKNIQDRIPEFVTKEETFDNDEIEEVHFVRKPSKETWTERSEVKVKSANKPNAPFRRIEFLTDTESKNRRPHDNKAHAHHNKDENIEDDEIEDVRFHRPDKETWTERSEVNVKNAYKPNAPVRRIEFLTDTESKTRRPHDNKPHSYHSKDENIEDDETEDVRFDRPDKETWTERSEVKVKSANKPNAPVRRIEFLTDTESKTRRPHDNKPHSYHSKDENIEDDETEDVRFDRPDKETWTERSEVKVKSANKPNAPVRRIEFLTDTESKTRRPHDNKPHALNNKDENIRYDETEDVRFDRPDRETWTERSEVKVKSANKPSAPVSRIEFLTDTESKTRGPHDKKPHAHHNKDENIEDDETEEVRFDKPNKETWTESNEVKVKSANKPNSPVRRIDFTTETESKPHRPEDKKPQAHNNKDENSENFTENDAKVNTMDNVLKFVKVVADTITKNTHRSFNSKLRYLEDLKDTIMINIEDRIESLYPDDSEAAHGARRRRWARSAEARGHVEFPSSEGALMTISFLTFAVYLIKLVLQVIQTYKNKTMMVTPVVASVGRAASGVKQTSK